MRQHTTGQQGASAEGRWTPILASGLLALWAMLLVGSLGLVAWLPPWEAAAPAGPAGPTFPQAEIVRLELAFTPARACEVLHSWGVEHCDGASGPAVPQRYNLDATKKSLRWDYLVLLGYGLLGWLTFTMVGRWLKQPHAHWRVLSWLPPAAALADLSENLGLELLLHGREPTLALTAAVGALATLKFALLTVSLMFAIAMLAFALWARRWRREHASGTPETYLVETAEVLAHERVYLKSRRERAGLPDEDPPLGLALSGGGIRSSTLSLGVVQVLAQTGLWRRIDYISTVSGGGYIGSALSSLLSFTALAPRGGPDEPPPWRDLVEESQFEFAVGDRPHFDTDLPDNSPFHDAPAVAPPQPHRQWLSGRMVVAHLRACGDFLVRRQRLLDRDMLRAVGIVVTAVAASLLMFAVLMLVPAALWLALMEHLGMTVFPTDGGSNSVADLAREWITGAGGASTLALATGLGALVAIGAAMVGGFSAYWSPDGWFKRNGDTIADAKERRALWVFAGLLLAAALVLPDLLEPLVAGLESRLLLVVAFLAGGVLGGMFLYVLLSMRVLADRLSFDNINRSYHGAAIALSVWFSIAVSVLTAITALPSLLLMPSDWLTPPSEGGALLISSLLAGALAWWRGHAGKDGGKPREKLEGLRGRLQALPDLLLRWLLGLAVTLVLVLGLLLAMVVVQDALRLTPKTDPGIGSYVLFALAVAVCVLVLNATIDFNRLSLHYFYRDRLTDAFLTTVARPADGGPEDTPKYRRIHGRMRLLDLHGRRAGEAAPDAIGAAGDSAAAEHFARHWCRASWTQRRRRRMPALTTASFAGAATAAPYHLYSACLNLATERDPVYRSRKSEVFIFSKLYCGSPATGFVDTGVYRSGETKVARAMTISGAAVDSGLGRGTFFPQAFATTLFNLRLGQWLENPGYRNGRDCWRQESGVFWPWYLLMETFGISDTRHRLVHLSDGGHTGDNLGLIPLLQRRCALILAVDGECDPHLHFASLMYAIQYAEADLGIHIDLCLDDLRPDAQGMVQRHYAIGTIHYPSTLTATETTGHLIVLKSSLHCGDAETVRMFAAGHAAFPHETTADQFFAEEQYEAYRRLGQNLAEQLVREQPELAAGDLTLNRTAAGD